MRVVMVSRGIYRVEDGTRRWYVAIAGPPENRWVWVDGEAAKLDAPASPRSRSRTTSHDVSAPMPATVVKLLVEIDQRVSRGDTLLMLEAMKMELPIRAPVDGIVTAINCTVGELVQPGHRLIDIQGNE